MASLGDNACVRETEIGGILGYFSNVLDRQEEYLKHIEDKIQAIYPLQQRPQQEANKSESLPDGAVGALKDRLRRLTAITDHLEIIKDTLNVIV